MKPSAQCDFRELIAAFKTFVGYSWAGELGRTMEIKIEIHRAVMANWVWKGGYLKSYIGIKALCIKFYDINNYDDQHTIN